jgi:hypothetical protein
LFIYLKIIIFDTDWFMIHRIGLGYVCLGEISFGAVELREINLG